MPRKKKSRGFPAPSLYLRMKINFNHALTLSHMSEK